MPRVQLKIKVNQLRIRDEIFLDGKKLIISYIDSSFADMKRITFSDDSFIWLKSDYEVTLYNGDCCRILEESGPIGDILWKTT